MRVLHVIGSLEDGGAEAVLYNLIQQTPHITHIVVPLVGRGKYIELLEKEGVEVHPLAFEMRGISICQSINVLRNIAEKTETTVIQTWMYHAAIAMCLAAKRRTGSRLYLSIHNTAIGRRENKPLTYACIRLLGWLQGSYAGIIYCSHSARAVHETIGYPGSKGRVITNGVCTKKFRPSIDSRRSIRASLGISDATHLFGMIARVHPQKNHVGLLQAIASLRQKTRKPFKVVLVGKGTDDNHDLKRLIADAELGDLIIRLGPRDDIPQLMSAIDTLVLPSAFGEAFPMVLCEAMSCGTPCIATDVGDSSAIIGDSGVIVPPGDSHALAEAMLSRLSGSPERIAFYPSVRQSAIEQFSVTSMAQRYEAAWAGDTPEKTYL